jgi:hypothetical protein
MPTQLFILIICGSDNYLKKIFKAKQSLLQKHSESEVTTLLEPFIALESDKELETYVRGTTMLYSWILSTKPRYQCWSKKELTVVANSFIQNRYADITIGRAL